MLSQRISASTQNKGQPVSRPVGQRDCAKPISIAKQRDTRIQFYFIGHINGIFRSNLKSINDIIVTYILLIDIFVLIMWPYSTGSLHQLPDEYLNSFNFDHRYPSPARKSRPSIIISDKYVVTKKYRALLI